MWILLALFLPSAHAQVRTELRQAVDRVDEWMGGARADDNRSSSTIRLRTTSETRRDEKVFHPEFHANFALKLGKVEDWEHDISHWFKERYDHYKAEWTKKPVKAPAPNVQASQLHQAPPPEKRDPWRFTLEKHLAVKLHPTWDIHPRVRRDFEFEHVIVSFATQAGYSSDTQWGSQGSLSATTQLAPRWTASLGNSATWAITDRQFGAGHGLSVAYLPGDRQVFVASANTGLAMEKKSWGVQSYSLNLGYRFSAWKDLFFFSFDPLLEFARAHRFYGDPGFRVSAEFVL